VRTWRHQGDRHRCRRCRRLQQAPLLRALTPPQQRAQRLWARDSCLLSQGKPQPGALVPPPAAASARAGPVRLVLVMHLYGPPLLPYHLHATPSRRSSAGCRRLARQPLLLLLPFQGWVTRSVGRPNSAAGAAPCRCGLAAAASAAGRLLVGQLWQQQARPARACLR
jgi:hypothetical protein